MPHTLLFTAGQFLQMLHRPVAGRIREEAHPVLPSVTPLTSIKIFRLSGLHIQIESGVPQVVSGRI